ncbi:MAG: EAL domain-containing protein [Xenococcaceae cyanobacterium MO_167.B27]|nr:EAL domain-containing protein [Xenococcaceae cyanobacterium MO_167.B27]
MNTINSSQEPLANILIVDDTSSNLKALSKLLQDEGYAVRCALDGATAITIAEAQWPDLILLDIVMPEIDGYEVCQQLKAFPKTCDIPVIFLSTLEDIFDKKKAFQVGGVDYVPKSYQSEEILIRIKNQLIIQSTKAEISRLNTELEIRVKERTEELEIANQKLHEEIIQRRQAEDKMIRKALQDPLTGLINRSSFFGKLTQAIQQLKKQPTAKFAVFLIDCESFKEVKNDYGIFEANQLLIAIANRLISCFPRSSYIGRFEADEYAIILYDVEQLEYIINIAEKIQKTLALPFELKKSNTYVNNSSIGIVLLNDQYQQIEPILEDANIALQESKVKNVYQIFHPEMTLTKSKGVSSTSSEDESYFKQAIANQEFIVDYQPVISLTTGKILELEALIRWNHPVYGLINASEFITLAEKTGLIVELGYLVILEACHQMIAWQQEHQINTKVSVNLSEQQFNQSDLIEKIDQILDATGIEGKYLKLEISEKVIANDPQYALKTLEKLQSRQIETIIDNFGNGYCYLNYIALTYLINFPIKNVKISIDSSNKFNNKTPEKNLSWDKTLHDMFELLINLSHQMNLKITVKDIESNQQLKYIKSLDCAHGQGKIISQPLRKKALEEMLLWTT